MDLCICMAASLDYSPETITTLLIGYTPIQNAFGVKKLNYNLKKKYIYIYIRKIKKILIWQNLKKDILS